MAETRKLLVELGYNEEPDLLAQIFRALRIQHFRVVNVTELPDAVTLGRAAMRSKSESEVDIGNAILAEIAGTTSSDTIKR